MDNNSFSDLWETKKPVEYDDTPEKRLDFIEAICVDDDGSRVENAEIHRIMQNTVFQWEQEGIRKGMIRVPYGIGKSTQITQALALYWLTVDKNELIIILTGKPSGAKARVKWIRNIIKNSGAYREWCKKQGLRPCEISEEDTGSTSEIYVKRTSTSAWASISGKGVNEGGTGYRCTKLVPDDIVNKANSRFKKDREKVIENWVDTWSQRVKADSGSVYGVFTPYHPKDANMKLVGNGLYAELKMRVSEDKESYELFERRPNPESDRPETYLYRKDLNVPLWEDGGHTKQYYIEKEISDPSAYQRGFRMEEDVVEEGDKAYPHYSKEYYPEGNVTTEFDYEQGGASVFLAVDFNYHPQCWSLIQRQGNKHVVFDEIRGESMTTQKMAKKTADYLKNRWGITFIKIIGDATPRKGREGYSDYDTMRDEFSVAGIRYKLLTGRSNPSVRNSITLLNTGLADHHGRRSILIHDRCKHVKRDFRKVERDEDGKLADKDSDLTHFSDGIRYYWWYIKKGSSKRKLPRLR